MGGNSKRMWAGAAAVLLLACASAPAKHPQTPVDEQTDQRGCIATWLPLSGKFIFEPFLKVADKLAPSESGSPEVWGFRLWNLEPADSAGLTKPVNVSADQFIPLGRFKTVPTGTTERSVRCPPYWQPVSGISAEDGPRTPPQ